MEWQLGTPRPRECARWRRMLARGQSLVMAAEAGVQGFFPDRARRRRRWSPCRRRASTWAFPGPWQLSHPAFAGVSFSDAMFLKWGFRIELSPNIRVAVLQAALPTYSSAPWAMAESVEATVQPEAISWLHYSQGSGNSSCRKEAGVRKEGDRSKRTECRYCSFLWPTCRKRPIDFYRARCAAIVRRTIGRFRGRDEAGRAVACACDAFRQACRRARRGAGSAAGTDPITIVFQFRAGLLFHSPERAGFGGR